MGHKPNHQVGPTALAQGPHDVGMRVSGDAG